MSANSHVTWVTGEKKMIIHMRNYGASWKKISKVRKVSIQKAVGVYYAWQRRLERR